MITSDEIKRRLWNGANELRGSMDASRYKDYMLGLMFYKFLSDKTLETFRMTAKLGTANDMELLDAYTEAKAEYGEDLEHMIQKLLGYYVSPEYLYQTWIRDINEGNFEVQKVADSFSAFERSIGGTADSSDFKGLFSSSTLDLQDTALGSSLNERSRNIKALIGLFSDLNMARLQKDDVLGDAYEYLIGMFAMESGKKAGEFYTPRQVSEVMAKIITQNGKIESIYDPAVGSGSLLLTVGRQLNEQQQRDLHYFGQEKNTATYNLTRMNLLLHGVRPNKMDIRNGDTLAEDWPEDPKRPGEGVQFDAVVMNPPYSAKNWNRGNITVSDPRFQIAGVLPPKSKGDYAFLLHGLYHLGQQGTMAIVLPHGVLFRGGSEGEIRKRLLDMNYLDAIIGMPSNLFTNTGIPVVVLILKKNRPMGEPLLVIDASNDFVKVGKQNALMEKDIARISDTYASRAEIKGYSHLADRDEIIENDYNLNIPRYIDAIDEEIPHDVDAHLYGGIPLKNVKDLKVLQDVVPDVLDDQLETIRPGYVTLKDSMEALTEAVMQDDRVLAKSREVREEAQHYIDGYWDKLRFNNDASHVKDLMEAMLDDIKALLTKHKYVDQYDGYQVIAEIWNDSLANDMEVISNGEYYTLARTRQPHMVTKGSGSNRREEQDGWTGTLIPTDLIEHELYAEQAEAIEEKDQRAQGIDNELKELAESAKIEDSDENSALFDALRKDADGEPKDTFDFKIVRDELKEVEPGTVEEELLEKANRLDQEKRTLKRESRNEKKALDEAVQNRILELTDEEIDHLMYKKWFGTSIDKLVELIEKPLQEELDTLSMLHDRYKETISDIDAQIREVEKELRAMMEQLVVTDE